MTLTRRFNSIKICFGQDRFTLIVDNLRERNYEIRNLPKGTKNPREDIRWMFLGFCPRPGQPWLLTVLTVFTVWTVDISLEP